MRTPWQADPADIPVSYAVPGERSSPKVARAFALGCGGVATNDNILLPGPVAMFGSHDRWALLQQAIADGREWFYGDHAFWRRTRYYRLTKNAYQFQPTLDDIASATAERINSFGGVELAPHWQSHNPYGTIVICPNSPGYMADFGIDAHDWVLQIVNQICRLTPRPIVIRWKACATVRPLYVDLHTASMVVVFSSNAAVDALAAGVPICTLAPWASTAAMGINDIAQINNPIYPEHRLPFLWSLAEHQWSLAEIEAGVAWRALNHVREPSRSAILRGAAHLRRV